jgi:hypothetical protein
MRSINENKNPILRTLKEKTALPGCVTGCKDRESAGDYDRMAGNIVRRNIRERSPV